MSKINISRKYIVLFKGNQSQSHWWLASLLWIFLQLHCLLGTYSTNPPTCCRLCTSVVPTTWSFTSMTSTLRGLASRRYSVSLCALVLISYLTRINCLIKGNFFTANILTLTFLIKSKEDFNMLKRITKRSKKLEANHDRILE